MGDGDREDVSSHDSPEDVENCCPPDTPGFAPDSPTDGRAPWAWESRWEPAARRIIRQETVYVAVLLALGPIGILLVWIAPIGGWVPDSPEYTQFARYAYSFLGGLLGGALIDAKWLYHVVAKGLWNEDRHLWRLLAPWISSLLAFVLLLLMSSGLVVVFNDHALMSPARVLGVSALIGLFSDAAVAKLSDLARTIFGVAEKHV